MGYPLAVVSNADLYPVDVLGARAVGLQALLLDPWGAFELDVDRIPTVAQLPDYLRSRRGGSTLPP